MLFTAWGHQCWLHKNKHNTYSHENAHSSSSQRLLHSKTQTHTLSPWVSHSRSLWPVTSVSPCLDWSPGASCQLTPPNSCCLPLPSEILISDSSESSERARERERRRKISNVPSGLPCRRNIRPRREARYWTLLNFLEFSPSVNTINVSLYCWNCDRINTILATFNGTYRNKTNYKIL
jgi:hypothetical protein